MCLLPNIHIRKNAMKNFIDKHTPKINGTIACFDRILFKGYLPISWAVNMQRFIMAQGLLFKDFKMFVTKHSERVKQHAKAMAEKCERPYIHINGQVRKEEKAREIANRDEITDGLVCVLSAVESCQSFKLAYGENRHLNRQVFELSRSGAKLAKEKVKTWRRCVFARDKMSKAEICDDSPLDFQVAVRRE